jgi:hypothetical protein
MLKDKLTKVNEELNKEITILKKSIIAKVHEFESKTGVKIATIRTYSKIPKINPDDCFIKNYAIVIDTRAV